MNQQYIPSCLRNIPKKRMTPRNQAIKESKVQIINQAIEMIRSELRREKLTALPIQYERGYLSAISKLEVLRDEIK